MRRRRSGWLARLFAFASLALASLALVRQAQAAPPVRLRLAEESTCEGARGLSTRLAQKGITVSESAPDAVEVDVRAMVTPGGAAAELVIRRRDRTARRSLSAPTCDEVLDALVFTLGLALEQALEPPTPPAKPPEPAPVVDAPPAEPPPPAPVRAGPVIAWGGGAGGGMFAGASPSAAAAVVVHGDVESRAPGLLAPSAILGAMIVLPSSTTASGNDVTFALQMATLDACPLRLGASRVAIRPCLELQVGRLQSRSVGAAGARLEAAPWVALALALRGRASIGAGFSLDLDVAAGSPLIQDIYFVGDQRVFGVGPVLVSAVAGVGVHFP